MKLKKLLKVIDPITRVVLLTPDSDDEPAFVGFVLDIPWHFSDYKIGRPEQDNIDEPIYFSDHLSTDIPQPGIVINLLPPEHKKKG